jgi:hypothetical protein
MMDFIIFAATRAEQQKGEERGGLGPFTGSGRLAEGARVRAYSDRRAGRGAVRREESGPSLEMVLTGGARVSASGRERRAYRFGTKRYWAVGLFWSWAASVPRGLLPFSLFFFHLFF